MSTQTVCDSCGATINPNSQWYHYKITTHAPPGWFDNLITDNHDLCTICHQVAVPYIIKEQL